MNTKRKVFVFPLLFLIAVLLYYPFQWIRIFTSVRFYIFMPLMTPNVLSLLAMSFILLSHRRLLKLICRKNLWALLSLAILFVIPLIQACFIRNYDFEYIAGGLFYPSVVLLGILYDKQFKVLLPRFASFLWITDLICMIFREHRLLRLPSDGVSHWTGLPGNRNWNATLMVITTPLLIYECDRVLKKLNLSPKSLRNCRLALYTPISLLSVYGIYVADSKGANIALFAAMAIVLFFGYKKVKSVVRSVYFKATIAAMVIVCAASLPVLVNSSYFDNFLKGSIRQWLWQSTVQMIGDHPLLGIGNDLYESEFAPYLPFEYYQNKHATDRNNHPHNHFLYIGASFGLIFLSCWILIIFYSILSNIFNLSEQSSGRKILFFAFLCLMLHAQFDLLAYQWPTNSMFLLLLGTLWGYFWRHRSRSHQPPFMLSVVITGGAFILLGCAVFFAQREFRSGFYYRAARIADQQGDLQQAIACGDRSISIKPTPRACYMNAMLSLYKLKNPQLCWHYLSLMYQYTPFKNYVRSASLSGRSLFMLGKREEALLFFIQSCRNFPLSCANWNCRAITLDALGRHQEAVQARCMIDNILKGKNLSKHDLPLLMGNPFWDVNAHKIPPELLYRNRIKKTGGRYE